MIDLGQYDAIKSPKTSDKSLFWDKVTERRRRRREHEIKFNTHFLDWTDSQWEEYENNIKFLKLQ